MMFKEFLCLWIPIGFLVGWIRGQTPPSIGVESCKALMTAKAVLTGNAGIAGQVTFQLVMGSQQLVVVDVSLSGLQKPDGFGDYTYHVHTHPVGTDGNCQAAEGHLDPFNVGDKTPCDFHQPQLCQTGDLSGKFGKISSARDTVSMHYIDPFLRFFPAEQSIYGRSVVLHAPDSTRLACGNITTLFDHPVNPSGTPPARHSKFETSLSGRSH